MPYNRYYNQREIPIWVRLFLIFGKFATNFGLIFMGFGLLFIILLSPVTGFEKLTDESPVVAGVVDSVNATKSSVNDMRVYAFNYSFTLPSGENLRGESFSETIYFEPGDTVDVQYSTADPSISRIRGMRSGEIGIWISLIFLPFVIAGFIIAAIGIRKSLKAIYLLRVGEVALAKLVKKQETSAMVNNQIVYKMHFQFTANDKQKYTTICKTYKTYWLEDDELERLVYDPNNPQNALMLDSLSRKLKGFLDRNIQ